MLTPRASSIASLALVTSLMACGSAPPGAPATPTAETTTTTTTTAPTAPTTPTTTTDPAAPSDPASGAKEGEACGDGVMGRMKAACASGLVCDMSNTAPSGPPGAAASARNGKCSKAK
jgi:hypothetical protein